MRVEHSELVRQLRELAELHASGAITDDEFAAAKALMLRGPQPDRAAAAPPVAPQPPAAPQPTPAPQPAPPGSGGQAPSPPSRHSGWDAPPMLRFPGDSGPPPRPGRSAPIPSREGPGPAPLLAGAWAGRGGAITAGVGSLLTLLAFLAMPMATVPFFGSFTGASLAGHASEDAELAWLWLVPIVAVAVLALAAQQIFGRTSAAGRTRGAGAITGLAGLLVFACFIGLARLQASIDDGASSAFDASATDFLGAGFWFVLIGMVAAGIGGIRELVSNGRLREPDL